MPGRLAACDSDASVGVRKSYIDQDTGYCCSSSDSYSSVGLSRVES